MGLNTMLHEQELVKAQQEAKASQEAVVMSAEHQKKQIRLSVATPILAAIVQADAILWASDPDACMSYHDMVEKSLKCADLLLAEIYKE